MEVTNLIEKCTKHSKDFATEVEKLWNDELSSGSGLSRKTRNVIRNILRDITKSLTTDKKSKCFRILERSTINGEQIKDVYKTIFNNGVDVESRINTTGKYVLFTVMTYAAAELRLIKSDEIFALLSRFFNMICDIHRKYGCGNMFVGIPAALIVLLEIDHINKLFSVFSTRYDAKAYLYTEYFLFLNINHYLLSGSDLFINVAYGAVSFSSPISVPDYIMEALTFKACDHIMKSGDLKYTYAFTKKVKDLFNTKSDSIYQYVRLHEMSYDGVSEDTDDDDEVFAILNLSIDSSVDRYRNRVLLLTPEVASLRKEYSEVEPDYKYLMDEEVPAYDKHLPKPITNTGIEEPHATGGDKEDQPIKVVHPPNNDKDDAIKPYNPLEDPNYVPTITRTAIGIADYQLVINKLIEWLDKCEEECGNGGEFKTELEEAKRKLTELNAELSDKLSKIRTLERDSVYKTERIDRLTKEIKELRDIQNGTDDGSDSSEIDKKTIRELRESLDREREMRSELEKELDTIRNGKVDGSCQRELELSRMWLKQRDDDLRAEIDKRRNVEWELSRLRRDIKECDKYKEDLDKAKTTISTYVSRISTLESEIAKYQQDRDTLSVVRRELEEERRRVRDLESRLDECTRNQEDTQEVDALRSRIRELENKLADCIESGGGNLTEISRLRSRISDLERQLSECRGNVTEINRLQSRISDLERQLNDCRRNNETNAETEREMRRLRDRISDLERQLSDCRRNNESNADMEREMQRLRDRIMDLDRQLNECKRNGNGTSSEEVNRLKTRIRDLERSLEICSKDESELYSAYKTELGRAREQISNLQESLRRERESDKTDSYYRRELTRERNKIVELEKELNKCFDANHAKYIDEINSKKTRISDLERQLSACKSNGGSNGDMDQYKREIESLKRELAECRRGNNGSHSDCKYYDEEAREEVKRLRQELTQLHEDLKRARESDKNDSYYKRELERQRAKVIEVEKELERYFDDSRLEECKRHGDEMLRKIADLERKLRDGGNGNGGNGCTSSCEFERKRIAVLEAEVRKSMETIKALEKFMEFDRLQKDCSDKLDRERERRMKAERDLEREIARKNCGGNPCERELESERSNVKRLEYQLDAEKEKVKFYKRELERDRYLSSRYLTSSSDPHEKPLPNYTFPRIEDVSPLTTEATGSVEVAPPSTDVTEPIGVTPSVDVEPKHPQLSEYQTSVSQVAVTPQPPTKPEYQSSLDYDKVVIEDPTSFEELDLDYLDDIDDYLQQLLNKKPTSEKTA
ncbi:A-type inclusion protein [Cowpox virus]|uniref:A-type inclusion protein n=1 Tax=Cowpox virus TaxID=10243 RepID=G0XSP0_COWPX|nr:A-type inclusion protein [Cowpox virus]